MGGGLMPQPPALLPHRRRQYHKRIGDPLDDAADCGVDLLPSALALDIIEQVASRSIPIWVFAQVDELGFECAEQALHGRVVPAVCPAALDYSSSPRRLPVLVFESFLQFWPSRRIAAPIIETARGLCNASRIFAGRQRISALAAQLLHARTDRLEIVSNARSDHVFLPIRLSSPPEGIQMIWRGPRAWS